MTANIYDKVELIPWDPTSDGHFQRMFDQRIACGWRHEEVLGWKEKMLNGQKFLFWIVTSEKLPEREELLKQHLEMYPNESVPLMDTALVIFNTAREPTNNSFVPVGHIALEHLPQRNDRFSFPTSTIWIMSLYISCPLQASGLGRSAMAQTERMAARPPLSCRAIALDTIDEKFQLSDTFLQATFEDRGRERPKTPRATEGWYLRQGYQVVEREEAGYMWKTPAKGEMIPMPVLYMLKRLD